MGLFTRQEKLEGLTFQPGYPSAIYNTSKKVLEVKANLSLGTGASFKFHVPALGDTIESDNGGAEFELSFLKPGKFQHDTFLSLDN